MVNEQRVHHRFERSEVLKGRCFYILALISKEYSPPRLSSHVRDNASASHGAPNITIQLGVVYEAGHVHACYIVHAVLWNTVMTVSSLLNRQSKYRTSRTSRACGTSVIHFIFLINIPRGLGVCF